MREFKSRTWSIACGLFWLWCAAFALSLLTSCSPPQSPAGAIDTDRSVVVLVRQAATWTWGDLSDGPSAGYRLAWEPYCNAFAVRGPSGLGLVTAAHCVPKDGTVRYLPPDGWGIDRAQAVAQYPTRDVAVLRIERDGGLVGLTEAHAPALGDLVWSPSAFWSAVARGAVTDAVGLRYRTTMGIERGWSGSPALDGQGRAWGVVVACETWQGQCSTTGSIVGAL